MKEKDNISNQGSDCLTTGMLLKYIKGELSGLEMNQVERHLAGCEMCSDELEGLSIMENPEKIDQISHELNQRIDLITTTPKKEIPYLGMYIRLAASIIIILGISTVIYFMAFRKTTEILPDYAQMEMMDIPESKPLVDSALKSEVDEPRMEGLKLAENREVEKNHNGITKGSAKSEEAIKYVAPVVVDSVALDDVALEVMEERSDKSIVVEETEMDKVGQVAESTVQAASSAERKRELAPGGVAKKEVLAKDIKLTYRSRKEYAIRLFSKEKYKEALVIFDEIRRDYFYGDTIDFYSSLCSYNLNRFKETIDRIKPLAKNPNGLFYDEARWYYALALIGDNRREEAISVLEQMVKENSPFKRKANRELERIKGD